MTEDEPQLELEPALLLLDASEHAHAIAAKVQLSKQDQRQLSVRDLLALALVEIEGRVDNFFAQINLTDPEDPVRAALSRAGLDDVPTASKLPVYFEIARGGCCQVVGDVVLISARELARLLRGESSGWPADDKWAAVIKAAMEVSVPVAAMVEQFPRSGADLHDPLQSHAKPIHGSDGLQGRCASLEARLREAEREREEARESAERMGRSKLAMAAHSAQVLDENDQLRAKLIHLEARYAGRPLTFDETAAIRLADEVAVLVHRRVIDARSPAGDALLDFRDPPTTPRADRMAELERDLEVTRSEARMHAAEALPDFEYRTRSGPPWDLDDPPAGDGWHRNIHRGVLGGAHIDDRRETYWMRRRGGSPEMRTLRRYLATADHWAATFSDLAAVQLATIELLGARLAVVDAENAVLVEQLLEAAARADTEAQFCAASNEGAAVAERDESDDAAKLRDRVRALCVENARLRADVAEWIGGGQAVVDLFDPMKARDGHPSFMLLVAKAARQAHLDVRAERDRLRALQAHNVAGVQVIDDTPRVIVGEMQVAVLDMEVDQRDECPVAEGPATARPARTIQLVWYQRPDGRWNADCACGGTLCGILDEERAQCEDRHYRHLHEERERGHARPRCGPRLPEPNPNLPGPPVFR